MDLNGYEIKIVGIDTLIFDPANARKHNPKNIEAIKGSLARFGQQKPIVIDKNNVVIAGNGTLQAAKELGLDKIAVHVTSLEGIDRTAKQKLSEYEQREVTRKKLASILDAVDGDIDSKFYGLIDYNAVVINPETGDVEQMSVTKAVEGIKKNFPEIIRRRNAPNLPSQAPGSGVPGTISRSEWNKLSSKEMLKWDLKQIID